MSDLRSWLGSRLGKESARLENRRMLDGAGHDMARAAARAHGADERQVVGFGAAPGEDDFVRLRTDQRRYLYARRLGRLAGSTTFLMQARRIAERSAQKWPHRSEHAWIERGSSGMIKINSRTHDVSPAGCAGPCAP